MAYDLVIRNGSIIDGSGSPSRLGDVAILGDRIAEIGEVAERGTREIDATGNVVTPGFIDGHAHMDAQVFWDPYGTSSCWHGVTTVVMGNCGFTLAPTSPDSHELVVRNLERAEDISADALAQGLDWSWESYPEYLDAVEKAPKAINYAGYVGHSALRTWAMGERAFEEAANEKDLAVMVGELERSMAAGAIGFSTSRSGNHETSDDRPVASRQAAWEEVCALVGVLQRIGRGVFEISLDPREMGGLENRSGTFGLLYELAMSTKVPVTFGLNGEWPQRELVLQSADELARHGAQMFLQTHSRGISTISTLRTSLPFDGFPGWTELRALPIETQLMRMRDPEVRRQLVESANQGVYGPRVVGALLKPNYDTLEVMGRPTPPNPTVADLAAARGVDPVELMIDLVVESEGSVLFRQPAPQSISEDQLLFGLKHPETVMTFSDSGAHVSVMMDSSIQTHLLAYWVRERGEFTLEEAVRMITSVPAGRWGFKDRGVVREGAIADLNIFDPARVGPELPTVDHDLPGGAKRLKQKSQGFLATLVGGEVTIENGEHTDAFPGRLLRAGA